MTSALTLTGAQLQVGSGSSVGATVVNAVRAMVGKWPYAWGGGDENGPTKGIRDGGVADSYGDYNKVGFDCSGLTLYGWAKAGVHLPHYSADQYALCTKIPDSQRQAGDLVFWSDNGSGSGVHHVAIWSGQNDTIIEALESGTMVRETQMRPGGEYIGAGRPMGGTIASLLGSGGITSDSATGTTSGGILSGISQYASYAVIGGFAIIALIILFTQVGNE